MVDELKNDETKNDENEKVEQEELNVPVDAAGNVDPDKAAPGDFPYPASVGPVPGYKSEAEKKEEAEKADKEGDDKVDADKEDEKADAQQGNDFSAPDDKADDKLGGDDKVAKGKKVPKQAPGSTDPVKNTPESHTNFFKPDGNSKL